MSSEDVPFFCLSSFLLLSDKNTQFTFKNNVFLLDSSIIVQTGLRQARICNSSHGTLVNKYSYYSAWQSTYIVLVTIQLPWNNKPCKDKKRGRVGL